MICKMLNSYLKWEILVFYFSLQNSDFSSTFLEILKGNRNKSKLNKQHAHFIRLLETLAISVAANYNIKTPIHLDIGFWVAVGCLNFFSHFLLYFWLSADTKYKELIKFPWFAIFFLRNFPGKCTQAWWSDPLKYLKKLR